MCTKLPKGWNGLTIYLISLNWKFAFLHSYALLYTLMLSLRLGKPHSPDSLATKFIRFCLTGWWQGEGSCFLSTSIASASDGYLQQCLAPGCKGPASFGFPRSRFITLPKKYQEQQRWEGGDPRGLSNSSRPLLKCLRFW